MKFSYKYWHFLSIVSMVASVIIAFQAQEKWISVIVMAHAVYFSTIAITCLRSEVAK